MRLANLDGRATIVTDDGIVRRGRRLQRCVLRLDRQVPGSTRHNSSAWYRAAQPALTRDRESRGADARPETRTRSSILNRSSPSDSTIVSTRPRSGLDVPKIPMVFTKFPSAVCGPNDGRADSGSVDRLRGRTRRRYWHRCATSAPKRTPSRRVAGYCVGQDYSEREWQIEVHHRSFLSAKSFKNFAPIGPWLTTADDVSNPNDLSISTRVNGEKMQRLEHVDMVFSVAAARSPTCRPSANSGAETSSSPAHPRAWDRPARRRFFLKPGDEVVTTIEGLGLGTIVRRLPSHREKTQRACGRAGEIRTPDLSAPSRAL